jgi:hypothetical protein
MVRSRTAGQMDKVSTKYKTVQNSQSVAIQRGSANERITWCSEEMHGG